MKIDIETLDGVKHEAIILPVDMVRFERAYDTTLESLGEHPKMEHLMFLAHSALARSGEADADFDAWLATVADFTPQAEVPLDQPANSSPLSQPEG